MAAFSIRIDGERVFEVSIFRYSYSIRGLAES